MKVYWTSDVEINEGGALKPLKAGDPYEMPDDEAAERIAVGNVFPFGKSVEPAPPAPAPEPPVTEEAPE